MNGINKIKEHFNLYYIFKEDKQKNLLSEKTIVNIWKMICDKMKK